MRTLRTRWSPWLDQVAREKLLGKLYDLAVEVSKGEIVGTLVHAESAEQARAFGRDLFPGCNVMAVLHDGLPVSAGSCRLGNTRAKPRSVVEV